MSRRRSPAPTRKRRSYGAQRPVQPEQERFAVHAYLPFWPTADRPGWRLRPVFGRIIRWPPSSSGRTPFNPGLAREILVLRNIPIRRTIERCPGIPLHRRANWNKPVRTGRQSFPSGNKAQERRPVSWPCGDQSVSALRRRLQRFCRSSCRTDRRRACECACLRSRTPARRSR